jgi:hypothetical protein
MMRNRQTRGWFLIAAIAIGIALVALLALHAQAGDSGSLAAILPLLVVAVISPLSLLPPLAYAYAGRTPAAPVLPARFQRPPPFRRA